MKCERSGNRVLRQAESTGPVGATLSLKPVDDVTRHWVAGAAFVVTTYQFDATESSP